MEKTSRNKKEFDESAEDFLYNYIEPILKTKDLPVGNQSRRSIRLDDPVFASLVASYVSLRSQQKSSTRSNILTIFLGIFAAISASGALIQAIHC